MPPTTTAPPAAIAFAPPHKTPERTTYIARRLEEFKTLQDGWADGVQPASDWGDGYGVAPSAEGLDWLADAFAARYSDDLPKPYVCPTPEGGVLLEWKIGTHRPSLEIDLTTREAEWHSLDLSTAESYEWDLKLDDFRAWEWLDDELRGLGDGAK